MSTLLLEHPDLDQLRRRAKEPRDAALRGDAVAVERFARHHPTSGHGTVTLAAAQLVVARELGFRAGPAESHGRRRNHLGPTGAGVGGRLHQGPLWPGEPQRPAPGLKSSSSCPDRLAVPGTLAFLSLVAENLATRQAWGQ